MALIRRYLVCAILWLPALLPVGSQAQTASNSKTHAQFRVVAMTDVETLLYDIDKKKEVLYAGVGSFSRLYQAPKNREVVFYKEVVSPDPKQPPKKVTLAKATLPPQQSGPFLILLNRNPAGAETEFSTLVIDHSLEAHPANTYRIFSFSKRRLAVRLANKDLLLSPGQSEKAPHPDARKAWLKVAADEKQDGWLLVSSSPHPVGSNSRTTIFLVDIPPSERDPEPKGIVARRFREAISTDDKGVQHLQ